MLYTVKKQLDSFSAAHRVIKGYQGKCRDLHGHDYLPEITLSCAALDDVGFVMDFSEIKTICNAWVQDNWDHATLLSAADPKLLAFVQNEKQKYFLLPDEVNSTVENLAEFLFKEFEKRLASFAPRVRLEAVSIWESATACATVSS